MLALIIAIVDMNPIFECFRGTLSGGSLIINGVSTILMIISVLATIFSGFDYIKQGKDLLK